MNAYFLKNLIENPSEWLTKRLFHGVPDVFWVDWREASNSIVELAAKALAIDDLSAQWIDGNFYITFRGQQTAVDLKSAPGDQDITLAALNSAVSAAFEIRFVKASDGGDTLAFLPLPTERWAELDTAFGQKVDEAFARIGGGASFFGDEHAPLSADALRDMKAQLKDLKFARVHFRLSTEEQQRSLSINSGTSKKSTPVIQPLCGDLVLSYFHDLRPTYPAVSVDELQEYRLSHKELRELAWNNALKAWRTLKIRPSGNVFEIAGVDAGMAACTILHDRLWDRLQQIDGPIVAAFPHRDFVLYARSAFSGEVAALREAVDRIDFRDAHALSRHLYQWQSSSWQILTGAVTSAT
jgi:Protein of unknown function (DUF1444)